LVSSDGTRVLADVANYGGLQLTSPLVGDDVAVGLGGLNLTQGQMTYVGVDDDIVTLAVGHPPDYSDLLVVRWSWRTGQVTPVARMPVTVLTGVPR
jgi:hypothetical protein